MARDNKRKFKYGRNKEALQKRASQTAFGDRRRYIAEGVELFSPNDGDNCIRIMPPNWEGAEHFSTDLWVHYGVGTNGDTVVCPSKMSNKACPVCEESDRLMSEGSEDESKKMKAKKRAAMYLVDRDNEEDGVKLWAAPWSIDRDISNLCIDSRTGEVFWVDDPEDGYDITFTKEGKGLTTKYIGLAIARRQSSVDDTFIDYIEENVLTDQFIILSSKELSSIMGTNDDDDDERPKTASKDTSRGYSSKISEPESRDDVFNMSEDDLVDFIEQEGLDAEGDDFDEIAEEVCNELGFKKKRKKRNYDDDDDDDDDDGESKLSNLRKNRS